MKSLFWSILSLDVGLFFNLDIMWAICCFPHDKQTCYHKSLHTRHIHKRGAFLGRGVIKRTQRVSSSERPKQHHRGPKTEGKKLDSQKQKNLEPVIEKLLKMSNLAIFNPRSLVIAESVLLTLQKEFFCNSNYQKKLSNSFYSISVSNVSKMYIIPILNLQLNYQSNFCFLVICPFS